MARYASYNDYNDDERPTRNEQPKKDELTPWKIIKKALFYGGLGFLSFSGIKSCQTIDEGDRGVKLTFGEVSNETPLQAGLRFKVPYVQEIIPFSVRTKKLSFETEAFTRDVQNVKLSVAVNYNLDPMAVNTIYKEYGQDIERLVIIPALLDVIKNDLGKWEAVKLVESREISSENIEKQLKLELAKRHVIVQDFRYEDIDFSDNFEKAIERKVTEEQETLTQQHVSEQEKKKKDQAITRAEAEAARIKLMATANADAIRVRAEAEAEALRAKGAALRENPEVLRLEGIQKWNGELPRVMTDGNSTILDLGNVTQPTSSDKMTQPTTETAQPQASVTGTKIVPARRLAGNRNKNVQHQYA